MAVNNTDRNTKTLLNKRATDSGKNVFEEVGISTLDIHNLDIYVEVIDPTPSVAIGLGIVEQVTLLSLTEDSSVAAQQGWELDGYVDVLTDKYGPLYTPRLFDSTDTEIFPTDDLDWQINGKAGYLTINGNASLFSQPFKSTFYRYIGQKGLLNPTDGYSDFVLVADIVARDAIAVSERAVGFTTFVQSTGVTYRLIGGVTNSDWQIVDRSKAASGTTLYVDSTTGNDDNVGSLANPLATLIEAVRRFPDEYSGQNIIECRGAGPYYPPTILPRPSSAGGSLDIIADRSAPYVANASPSYSLATGTYSRFTSSAFGAHSGLTADGYWMEVDVSIFGASFSPVIAVPLFTTGAGTGVDVVSSFNISTSYPQKIHLTVTELNIENANGMKGNAIDGGFVGTKFVGFLVQSGTNVPDIKGCSFMGCEFRGLGRFADCNIGGHAGAVGTNQLVLSSSSPGGTGSQFHYFYSDGGFVTLEGQGRMSGYFEGITVSEGSQVVIDKCDFRPLSGACISYRSTSAISFGANGTSVGAGAENVLDPGVDNSTNGASITMASNTFITGSVSGDAFVLQNGSGITNVDHAVAGLTIGGSDLVIDGTSFAFTDIPIFSLDSGCYVRT